LKGEQVVDTHKSSAALLIAALSLLAAADSPVRAQQEEANTVSVIPTKIDYLPRAQLKVGGQQETVTVAYCLEGTKVTPFPVWVARGDVWLIADGTERIWKPGHTLWGDGPTPQQVRLTLLDLLRDEEGATAVKTRLRTATKEDLDDKAVPVKFQRPQVQAKSYRVTLIANVEGTTAVPISESVGLTPLVVQQGAPVTFRFLSLNPNLTKKLKPADVYIQVEGLIKARYEQEILSATLTSLSHSLETFANKLGSEIAKGGATKAVLYIPAPAEGGQAEQTTSAESAFSHYLSIELRLRVGLKEKEAAGAMQLIDKLLAHMLSEISVKGEAAEKRFQFILGSAATLSATMGQIKKLIEESDDQQEKQLDKLLKEAERNVDREAIEGSASAHVLVFGGDAKFKYASDSERARAHEEHIKTMQRSLKYLKKHFEGTVPMLTGIRVEQGGYAKEVGAVTKEIKQSAFTTGWYQFEWPIVLLPLADSPVGSTPAATAVDTAADKKTVDKPPGKRIGPVESPNKLRKASADGKTVTVTDAQTGKIMYQISFNVQVIALRFNTDRTLYVGGMGDLESIFEAASGNYVKGGLMPVRR
jgi:hypothetical protein